MQAIVLHSRLCSFASDSTQGWLTRQTQGSREMGTDRKRCAITPFHKNRQLGFPKRHRSKRMPILRQADKADSYI